ncbi:hypothetical protein BHE74_00057704 [Ensete ventricosum]|nr:hypothetical protein BHE74_00057704 [Ensete ventricosum]
MGQLEDASAGGNELGNMVGSPHLDVPEENENGARVAGACDGLDAQRRPEVRGSIPCREDEGSSHEARLVRRGNRDGRNRVGSERFWKLLGWHFEERNNVEAVGTDFVLTGLFALVAGGRWVPVRGAAARH